MRQQAITWASAEPDLCHYMASLNQNELKQTKWMNGYFNGLVQERGNSSALAMELPLSCTNPLINGLGVILMKAVASQDINFRTVNVNPVVSLHVIDQPFTDASVSNVSNNLALYVMLWRDNPQAFISISTYWSPGDVNEILKSQFSILFYLLASSYLHRIMPWGECNSTLLMMSQHWFR